MCGTELTCIFREITEREEWHTQEEDSTTEKIENGFCLDDKTALEMERKRKRNAEGSRQLGKKVIVRTQPVSDAIPEITDKFTPMYETPYAISKILDHEAYEFRGFQGRIREEFSKKQLRQ